MLGSVAVTPYVVQFTNQRASDTSFLASNPAMKQECETGTAVIDYDHYYDVTSPLLLRCNSTEQSPWSSPCGRC